MNSEDQIILVALRNAYLAATKRFDQTPVDYQLRKIFRWYSETFHTPLHLVYELPLEDVLTHYWEAYYEDMKPEEMMQDIRRMIRSPEETRKLQEQEDRGDAESFNWAREEQKLATVKKLDEVVNRFRNAIVQKTGGIKAGAPKMKEVDLVQPTRTPPPKIEERIQMRFAMPDETEDDMDSLGLLDDPKSK